jgi:hypothetical protein
LLSNKHTIHIVALAVVLLACLNSLAQKVTIDFDKDTDFSRSKTYAWIKGTPASNPKLDQYIVAVGDHQLEKKRLTKVEAKDADLLITYHAATNAEINATLLDNDSYAFSLGLPQTTVVTWALPQQSAARLIRKGTLAFEIIDRQRHQLIWISNTKVNLDEKRNKALDQLDKALIKVFNGYPPPYKLPETSRAARIYEADDSSSFSLGYAQMGSRREEFNACETHTQQDATTYPLSHGFRCFSITGSSASSGFRDRAGTQLDQVPRESVGEYLRQIRQVGCHLSVYVS